jgi:uncharacterized protein with von Willebrand factor type A (vWA) domain
VPTQKEMIDKLFGRSGARPAPLPRQTVDHNTIDKMRFSLQADGSPQFREVAIENAPRIAPDVPDPDPIDFTTADPDEIREWQAEAKKAKAAREQVDPYNAWDNLTRDVFYSYHHRSEPNVSDNVDPSIKFHSKILSKMIADERHAQARNVTRDEATPAAIATLGAVKALKEALADELVEQARQGKEVEEAVESAEAAMQNLDALREQAKDLHAQGQPVPGELVDAIKQAVKDKRGAQAHAADAAAAAPLPFDQKAHDACVAAARAGADAAEMAQSIPGFGQGFGEGEPRYESPEQALTIAEMWATNPILLAVSQLYGRMKREMEFDRAKRVVGGQDEIVDLKLGDELRRVLPTEFASLSDPELEDDFYARYLNAELRVYDTVGEEHAGRGPIILSCDESMSMKGERNVWSKAMAMCLLNMARREKRDFAYVGWASGTQVYSIIFKAKEPLDPEAIIEMASHFFDGGTTPILGLATADEIMATAEFRKADVVKISDGEATFGPEDERIRNRMSERGVRFHGIGIGGSFTYLRKLTEDVVNITDFELQDPSEATAHLATHIT